MVEKLINQGAEAKILLVNEKIIKKIRDKKEYRLNEIDLKLRKQRTKREFKIIEKLYKNKVLVPKPINIDLDNFSLEIEFINGTPLKECINEKLICSVFEQIIKMHSLNITHGDLTTLNMIVKKNKVYLIDFGLAKFSQKNEDKAVDLNLFFTCLKNEHKNFFYLKEELIKKYENKSVIEKLKKLEKRGRNKNK